MSRCDLIDQQGMRVIIGFDWLTSHSTNGYGIAKRDPIKIHRLLVAQNDWLSDLF